MYSNMAFNIGKKIKKGFNKTIAKPIQNKVDKDVKGFNQKIANPITSIKVPKPIIKPLPINSIVKPIGGMFNDIGGGIVDVGEGIGKGAGNIIGGAGDFVLEGIDRIGDAGANILGKVGNSFA